MFKLTRVTQLFLFFVLFFIYQELLFHITSFQRLDWNILYLLLLTIPVGGICYLFCNFFSPRFNRICCYIILLFFLLFYSSQWIYHQIYHSVISVYSISNGGQVFQFMQTILSVILKNWWYFLLLLLPIIGFIVLDTQNFVSFIRVSSKKKGILLISLLSIHFGVVLSMEIFEAKGVYANTKLYHTVHAPLLTANRFGLTTMTRLDLQRYIFGFREGKLSGTDPSPLPPIEKEKQYNMLEIDWNKLIESEKDENVKDLHKYFSSQSPTEKNNYTGMFKGKNLIVFVAEAFSNLAIDKKLTPNLYKLYEEGFQFTNFYTPLFPVSTADGEYMTDTSLLPKEGVWSIYRVKDNYMPLSYANIFKKLGYTTQAYHNNTYTYYKRDQYLKAMEYDSYLACGNGLEKKINCRVWPQSDLEMIDATVNDYLSDDQFLTYYMSVSGHLEYSKIGNQMVTKNWNDVKDLNISDKAKSYLAANIEFDKAIGSLMKHLKETGRDKDTVIAISGDHYPYGLDLDEINELSNYRRDKDFSIHHMPFLLWSKDMKEPVKITKVGSSLDVVPTLYNLFGVDYDSRLFMGVDLLSNESSIAIFSNRSFLIDQGRYNALTKSFTPIKENIGDQELEQFNVLVYNKFKYSRLVLENDYYRKLYQSLEWIK